jgi:hypothetical protein
MGLRIPNSLLIKDILSSLSSLVKTSDRWYILWVKLKKENIKNEYAGLVNVFWLKKNFNCILKN